MAKKNKNYIIAAVVVILIIILLIAFTGKEAPPEQEAAAEEPAPEPEPVAEEAAEPVAEEKAAEPVAEEETATGEKVTMGGQTNVEAIEEYIVYNPGGAVPIEKTEGESWFSAITCQHAQMEEGEKSQEKLDKLSFKLTNKKDKEYVLRYVKYGDPDFDNAMRVQINGRRVRDIEVACGKETIKPGETLYCENTDAYLREGESYTGKQLVNSLAAETTHYKTKIVFTC